MNKKRFISFILILVLLFSQSLFVLAEDDDSDDSELFWRSLCDASAEIVGCVLDPNDLKYASLIPDDVSYAFDNEEYWNERNATLQRRQIDALIDNGYLLESIDKTGKKQYKVTKKYIDFMEEYCNEHSTKYTMIQSVKFSNFVAFQSRADVADRAITDYAKFLSQMKNVEHDDTDVLYVSAQIGVRYNAPNVQFWGGWFPSDTVFIFNFISGRGGFSAPTDFDYVSLLNDAMNHPAKYNNGNYSLQMVIGYLNANGQSFKVPQYTFYQDSFTQVNDINTNINFILGSCWFVSDTKTSNLAVYKSLEDYRNLIGRNQSVVKYKDVDTSNIESILLDQSKDFQQINDTLYEIYKNGDWQTAEQLKNLFNMQLDKFDQLHHDLDNALNDDKGNSWLRNIWDTLRLFYLEFDDYQKRSSSWLENLWETLNWFRLEFKDYQTDTEGIFREILEEIKKMNGSASGNSVSNNTVSSNGVSADVTGIETKLDIIITELIALNVTNIIDMFANDEDDSNDNTKKLIDDAVSKGAYMLAVRLVANKAVTKFPFSVPNDIYLLYHTMYADPLPPDFNIPINFMGHETSFSIDLQFYETYMKSTLDFFILLAFIGSLLVVTIKVLDIYRS